METLLLCLALQEVRVTLELSGLDFPDAAELALAPFGDSASWIDPRFEIPWERRLLDLNLKNAGYFEVLDRLERTYAETWLDSRLYPEIALEDGGPVHRMGTVDLSSRLRLVAFLNHGLASANLIVVLLHPPTNTPPAVRLEKARINGRPSALSPSGSAAPSRQGGYASFRGSFRRKPCAPIHLEGVLVIESVEGSQSFPFVVESVVLPLPSEPGRPIDKERWAGILGGIAAGATVVLAGLALFRPRPTSG